MRKSAAEKKESRQRILAAAAELFRRQGIETTSVNDVMQAAGMTHGGFYRHFASKEDLVAAAIVEAYRSVLTAFDPDRSKHAREVLDYVERYLSDDHANRPEVGCPLPALGAETARGPEAWQQAMVEAVYATTEKLREGLPHLSEDEALAVLSTMVGSLVLARAAGRSPLRQQLLAAGRKAAAERLE